MFTAWGCPGHFAMDNRSMCWSACVWSIYKVISMWWSEFYHSLSYFVYRFNSPLMKGHFSIIWSLLFIVCPPLIVSVLHWSSSFCSCRLLNNLLLWHCWIKWNTLYLKVPYLKKYFWELDPLTNMANVAEDRT